MAERITWNAFNSRLSDDDIIQVTVTAGTPGAITFTLTTAPEVTWWKALKILRTSGGSLVREVTAEGSMHGPVSMTLTAAELAGTKLELAKAKIFGIHTGMYELFELTPQLGKTITFDWRIDGPTSIWGQIWGFFRDLVEGVVEAVVAVGNFIVSTIEYTIGMLGNIFAYIVSAIFSIPIIGPLLRMIVNAITWFIAFVVNLVIELVLGFLHLAGLFRQPPEKLLRLLVVIQRDESGREVATMAQVVAQLEWAIRFYQTRMNVKIVPVQWGRYETPYASSADPADQAFVVTETDNSTTTTLDVRCRDGSAFADYWWTLGSQLELKMSRYNFVGNTRRVLGFGSPIVAFAVRQFTDAAGTGGCAVPVASRYILIAFGNSSVTALAHEMSHLCNLWVHVDDDPNNLMQGVTPPPPDRADLTNEQVFLVRTSNHVSLF